jgi:RNA polymerase sigma-70 factor, ECF subfamily
MDPRVDDPAQVGSDPTDGQLAAKAQGGDRRAFDQLVVRYQKRALGVSYRLLGNTQDALEVTQDAFLKAFTSIKTLQNPQAVGGWMMRIVSNLSLNYRRSRKSRTQLPLDDLLDSADSRQAEPGGGGRGGDDPAHLLQSREMGVKLQQALDQLPEKQRLAIIMFTIEEMPQKDVAQALDCSVEAVKWHVFQGRKKLREMLKDHL